MKIREVDLPGLGKKYAVSLKSGEEIVIVIHNTGKREIYIMEDEESRCSIELTDDEAKEIGFILAGAKYETVSTEKMELIMKDIVMEWIKVKENSKLINRTISELEIRRRTGASIIAIERGGKIIPNPDPYTEKIQLGDIVIVVGTRQQIKAFLDLCG